ncbi:RUN and FYVE domain-containing protein 1, partial [Parelaphostrongylus tenuis]
MSSPSGFSLMSAFSENGHRLSRSQRLHRDNERRNLLTITRLVLRAFLERTMSDNNRILESDTQQVTDLLIMLEKVLWHGFKPRSQKSLIFLKSPDAEMWAAIERIAQNDVAMQETANCVAQIESLLTPISRLRAFLRLAMMQKKLFDFFTVITSSSLLKNFYEDWALLRQEEIVQLTGSLLGLSVVDCNLALEYDYLQDQPLSIDLTIYIRIPTVPTEGEETLLKNGVETRDNVKKMLLDQNNYLEERNRQLQCNVENLKKRLNSLVVEVKPAKLLWNVSLLYSKTSIMLNVLNLLELTKKTGNWNEKRLLGQVVEREDSLTNCSTAACGYEKINTDLYDKLKLADDKWRRLEKDLMKTQQQYSQETETLKKTFRNWKFQTLFFKKTHVSKVLMMRLFVPNLKR